jgi:hypothetical protein
VGQQDLHEDQPQAMVLSKMSNHSCTPTVVTSSQRKGKRGLKARILELFHAGFKAPEIARRVGCTRTNVWRTIHRHVSTKRGYQWNGYVGALPPKCLAWLEREVKRTKATAAEVTAALLVDAIEQAIEEDADLRLRTSVKQLRQGIEMRPVIG